MRQTVFRLALKLIWLLGWVPVGNFLAPGRGGGFLFMVAWLVLFPKFVKYFDHRAGYRALMRVGWRYGLSMNWLGMCVAGVRNSVCARIAPGAAGGWEMKAWVEQPGRCRIPRALGIRPRSLPKGCESRLTDGFDYKFIGETGDPDFDRDFMLMVPQETFLAVLAPEVRRAFIRARASGMAPVVLQGNLVLGVGDTPDEQRCVELIETAFELVDGVACSEDSFPARLAARALHDPTPVMRRKAFLAFAEGDPAHPGLLEPALTFLDDPDPEVRLHAGIAAGPDGLDALAGLVRLPPPGTSRRTVALRGDRLPELRDPEDDEGPNRPEGPEQLQTRALAHLAEHFPSGLVLPLVRESLRRQAGPLRLAAWRLIASLGDASCENDVVDALAHASEGELPFAVAALGTFGTPAAVPHLRALDDGRFFGFSVRGDIRGAVAAIHARSPHLSAGQVSLASPDAAAGRVSLAPAGAGGEVALSGPPPPGDTPPRGGEAAGR